MTNLEKDEKKTSRNVEATTLTIDLWNLVGTNLSYLLTVFQIQSQVLIFEVKYYQ